MIAKLRFKKANDEGPKEFTLKRNLTVPLISLAESKANTERTFLKDKKVKGEHVLAQIIKKQGDKFVPYGETEACMVQDQDGVYLIPLGELIWNAPVWDEQGYNHQDKKTVDKIYGVKSGFDGQTEQGTEEVMNAYNSVKDKKYFGFTVQQLLIITGITFIITKIAK